MITVTEPLYHKDDDDDDDRIYFLCNTLPTSTETSTRKFLPSPLFSYSNWLSHHHQLNVSMANIPQQNQTKFIAEFSTKIKISILANPLYFISQHHRQQPYTSFVMKLELCTSMKIQHKSGKERKRKKKKSNLVSQVCPLPFGSLQRWYHHSLKQWVPAQPFQDI